MKKFLIIFPVLLLFVFNSCSDNSKVDKGVGPIKELKIGEIEQGMAEEGKALFQVKCTRCHQLDKQLIGSPLRGITNRRTPEWIMNMMLNPDGMISENKAAKELFEKTKVRMAPDDVKEADARKILEYLRTEN